MEKTEFFISDFPLKSALTNEDQLLAAQRHESSSASAVVHADDCAPMESSKPFPPL